MIKIAPRNGMIVIDPATRRPMPTAGIERESLDTYWLRRLSDGDVVQVEETPELAPVVVAPKTRRKTAEGK